MIPWVTVEDAIHDWIVSATGIPGARVIPIDQNGPRPDGPYVDFDLDVSRIGQDWVDVEDADTPSPGAEIVHKARGTRRMVARLRCFGGDASGAASSKALLENVQSTYVLPVRHAAIAAAGIGVASFSTVTNISGVINSTRLEARAMLDVTCYLGSEVEEAGTYVSAVEVTDQISDPDNVFTVGTPLTLPFTRITEGGDTRVSEGGDTRVTEAT